MRGPSVYGHVTVRPVRVGLVDAFESVDSVVAAAIAAAERWGGLNYLLFPEPLSERATELATNIGVDVMAAIPGVGRAPFDVPPTFEFRSYPHSNPFDKGDGTLHHEVLEMQSLAQTVVVAPAPASVPGLRWNRDHPLATLLAVLHGTAPSVVGEAAATAMSRPHDVNLGSTAAVPPDMYKGGRLRGTLLALKQRRPANYRGIVCIDVNSPSDLVGFWNLRATGADVVAYVPGQHELVKDYVAAWLAQQLEQDSEQEFRLWSSSNAFPLALRELHDFEGGMAFIEELAPVPVWAFVLPLESHFSERFEVSFDAEDWSVDVPLPRVNLLPPASWYERFGTVAAEVEVVTEREMPQGRALTVPLSRSHGAQLLRAWASPGMTPFLRSTVDGVVAGVDVRAAKVSVPLLDSMQIFATLFKAAGLEVKRSDAGLYCERIIDMFGGVQPDGIALHPAIRAVLYQAAQSPFGSAVQALIATAKQKEGEWPDSIFGRGRDYPTWVIHWLCDNNFLHARLKTKCPTCGNGLSIAPSDVADEVVCPLCGKSRALALHLSALKPHWRLALHRHLQAKRLAETLPVLAALSILASIQGYAGRSLHHGVGVRVTGDIDCELDLIAATHERGSPVVVIGECKSYRDVITPTDVANLSAVQNLWAATGVECYVLYATMHDTFRPEEVDAIRGSAIGLRSTGVFRRQQALAPIAPIVLDGRSLSTHSFSQNSPLQVEPGPTTLSSLAIGSCKGSLGLVSADLDPQDPRRYVTTWS